MIYIPSIYFFKTRAKTVLHKGSFFILIVFPIFAMFFQECRGVYGRDIFPIFLAGFVAMFSVYEIGYLYNDFETTRFENSPSYWMPLEEHKKLEIKFEKMIAVRVLYIVVCVLVLNNYENLNTNLFLLALAFLNLSYAMHNSIRSRWNIITDALLQILKYCSILLLNGNNIITLKFCLMMILAVPVIRTIEFTRKERLDINCFKKIDVNLLRIGYHFLCAVIAFVWNCYDKDAIVLVTISIVLMIYRLISYAMLKNSYINRIRSSNFDDVK